MSSDRKPVSAVLAAFASDGVAVDAQRVQQNLWVAASRLRALRLLPPVVDQRSVAVRPPGPAFAAVVPHNLFIASQHHKAPMPRRANLSALR